MDYDTPSIDEAPKPIVPAPLRVAIGVTLLASFLFGVVMLISPAPPRTNAAAHSQASHIDLIGWQPRFDSVRHDGTPGNMQPKPILLVFTADYCPPCLDMKDNVYTDEDLASLIREKFIPVQVDMTEPGPEQYELARRYRVEYLPTIIVLNQAEREVVRANALNASRMDRMLNAALTYVEHNPPRFRRRSQYDDFNRGGGGFGFRGDNNDSNADDNSNRTDDDGRSGY